jgi:hypothetical protein
MRASDNYRWSRQCEQPGGRDATMNTNQWYPVQLAVPRQVACGLRGRQVVDGDAERLGAGDSRSTAAPAARGVDGTCDDIERLLQEVGVWGRKSGVRNL